MESNLEKGISLYKLKRFDEALKFFKKISNEEKDNPEVNYYLGLLYTRLNDYDAAIEQFNIVLKNKLPYRRAIQIRKILGFIYTQKGEYDLAKELFKRIIELNFNDSSAYAALGYINYKTNNIEEALKNLRMAIKIDSNNANAHNSLGYIYADTETNIAEAVLECERALKLSPDYPAYLDSLGWAHYKSGNLAEAKKYLRKAMALLPENSEIKKHLQDVIRKELLLKSKID